MNKVSALLENPQLLPAECSALGCFMHIKSRAVEISSTCPLESQPMDTKFVETGLVDRVIQPEGGEETGSFISTLPDYGGFAVRLMGAYNKQKVENVLHWFMLVTTSQCPTDRTSAYIAYGNEASLGPVYGDVGLMCASVRQVKGWLIQPSCN